MIPDSKVRGGNMGPIWGRQDPGGPHVGPMNFAIWNMQMTLSIGSCKHNNVLLYLENPWRFLQEGTKSLFVEGSCSHRVCHSNLQLTIHASGLFVLDECHYQLAHLGDNRVAIQLILCRISCLVQMKLWWWHCREQWNCLEDCVIIQLSKWEVLGVASELKYRTPDNHLRCGWHEPGLLCFYFYNLWRHSQHYNGMINQQKFPLM